MTPYTYRNNILPIYKEACPLVKQSKQRFTFIAGKTNLLNDVIHVQK